MTVISHNPLSRAQLPAHRRRRKYRSSDAFCLTILIFCAFALFSYAGFNYDRRQEVTYRNALAKRDAGPFASTDEECRMVRHSKDQCAYIAKHCPDEDAGFYSYLALFYCSLSKAKPVAFIILVSWLGLLFSTIGIAASDFFCINLSTIAAILGMSESLAGVTFLAFGNGSPDVFSTFAAFTTDSSSLAIGELFGAACFIAAVVAGSMGVVRPFKVAKKAYMRDIIFFAIAAIFSLFCMWDGKLHVWECLAMVGYYVLYVITVVVWHWWFTRRKRRQDRISAARGQYILHVTDEEQEEYRDEPDEEGGSRPSLSRGPSTENFSLLERAQALDDFEDVEDDEERDRIMANLQSNMHLNRPAPGQRRNTLTPIRPSLVGALEYRALVASLQKSRSHQVIPMDAQPYSDDHAPRLHADNISTTSDPESRPAYYLSPPRGDESPLFERPTPEVRTTTFGRSRAVSANDALGLKHDPGLMDSHGLKNRNLLDVTKDDNGLLRPPSSVHSLPLESIAETPDVVISEAASPSEPSFWRKQDGAQPSFNLLAPPGDTAPSTPDISPSRSPASLSPRQSPPQLTRLKIPSDGVSPPGSAPMSPFPAYTDIFQHPGSRPASIYLGPPSISAESHPCLPFSDDGHQQKRVRWWPYNVLPPPEVLLYRLFPTFQHWCAKSWWERILAVVAAPSIFFLTITLPVVDIEREDEPIAKTPIEPNHTFEPYSDVPPLEVTKSNLTLDSPVVTEETPSQAEAPGHGSAAVAANIERTYHDINTVQAESHSIAATPMGPQPWNRWLTITQMYLAPLFMVVVIYTQYLDLPSPYRPLIKPICVSLLVSTLLLVVLLLTTTPYHRPKPYETILSLAGFVVAIGWISTIASQVVAVLKALAVILNMSHAVMGLTIFAVGNSLGDLVADITVAKLGFPVMALSACFGGPMLNILLGIGLSGSYILIRGAQHRHKKHPGKNIEYRSYNIEVGTTLMISGVTLVFTLLVLAIAVPLNKWTMSKKLGWGLIALWTISTLGNVIVVELMGVGQPQGEAWNTYM
ncbi:hypothetical protein AAFC00_003623 [Neodothiora populina]|uniref:Sodium/calcium exchanger membrane region domain-containing protein n=1 Tax=Neodothiora populina TaxID=2781224 RepID=A0ABR3PEW7_9PEZI